MKYGYFGLPLYLHDPLEPLINRLNPVQTGRCRKVACYDSDNKLVWQDPLPTYRLELPKAKAKPAPELPVAKSEPSENRASSFRKKVYASRESDLELNDDEIVISFSGEKLPPGGDDVV